MHSIDGDAALPDTTKQNHYRLVQDNGPNLDAQEQESGTNELLIEETVIGKEQCHLLMQIWSTSELSQSQKYGISC
jgi:hypothetical protein